MANDTDVVLVLFQVPLIQSHPDILTKIIRKLDKTVDTSQLALGRYPLYHNPTYIMICSGKTAKKALKLPSAQINVNEVLVSGNWLHKAIMERRGNKPQVYID